MTKEKILEIKKYDNKINTFLMGDILWPQALVSAKIPQSIMY